MVYHDRLYPLAEQVELPYRPDAILAYRYYTGRSGKATKRLALLTREGKIYVGRDVNRVRTMLDQKFVELLSAKARALGLEPEQAKHWIVCPECGLPRPECQCHS